ncbi:MAG: RsfS/YbeB/iojap family protein, partial [Bryobacteraceae bacterium]
GEAIEERLDREGIHLAHREGKTSAEWVLLDYGYFVVHIFSERALEYYDLERLWREAKRIDFPAPSRPPEEQTDSGRDSTY